MPADPNVVFICCDDLGYGDLGCYGAEYATPRIDEIANGGVRFTDHHSMSPICSPSRAAYLTGRRPHDVGVPWNVPAGRGAHAPGVAGLPPEEPTLADRLSAAGYNTGAVGKWHLGMSEMDGPLAHGFDSFFGFRSGCVDYYSHRFVWGQDDGVPPYHDLLENGNEVYHDGEYLTELLADRSVEFIGEHAGEDDPFFLYTAFNAPHYPLHAPARYREQVANLGPERQAIAAMVLAVDAAVGRIAATLDSAGVREETLLVFTSDHGPSREVRNHHDGSDTPFKGGSSGGFRGAKLSLFEGGIRVPAIVEPPVSPTEGAVSDAFVTGLDLVPTVLDYCGLDAGVLSPTGVSVRPAVEEGESIRSGEPVVWECGDTWAVRRDEWKLTTEDGLFLANLADDPRESTDRSEDRPDLLRKLRGIGETRTSDVSTSPEKDDP